MKVQWWPGATIALLNLSPDDAAAVDRAVARWAASGEGIVHASEGGVFLLFVGAHVVEFLFEDSAGTMHVERVRRA